MADKVLTTAIDLPPISPPNTLKKMRNKLTMPWLSCLGLRQGYAEHPKDFGCVVVFCDKISLGVWLSTKEDYNIC